MKLNRKQFIALFAAILALMLICSSCNANSSATEQRISRAYTATDPQKYLSDENAELSRLIEENARIDVLVELQGENVLDGYFKKEKAALPNSRHLPRPRKSQTLFFRNNPLLSAKSKKPESIIGSETESLSSQTSFPLTFPQRSSKRCLRLKARESWLYATFTKRRRQIRRTLRLHTGITSTL